MNAIIPHNRVPSSLAARKLPDQKRLFRTSLPKKAYCTNDLSTGIRVRDTDAAITQKYIQPNAKNSKVWLMYDVDRPTCVYEITDDLNLPAPHFFVQNPANQHAHVYYGLETAVHLNQNSSQKALRFAGAVDCAMSIAMQADANYCGLIAKNPLHEHWKTNVINSEMFSLGDLSEYLDLTPYNDRRRNLPDFATGRNVNLFERLRKWAYTAIRQGWPDLEQWERACFDRAIGYNRIENPLPISEVKSTARSVARWTHKNMSPEGFSRLQAVRGSQKGQNARDANLQAVVEMSLQGHSNHAIADTLGLPRSTVIRWLKRSS